MAIQSRFGRIIKFENEQRRQRYIKDTQELARKHMALQQKWDAFAASTGMPSNFNAKLEQGAILSSDLAHEFGLARLDYERSVNSYFKQHEDTLRAIGEGRLYQEERKLDAPLPLLAREETPEAKGFQELLKYELYGPTDTQRVEAATERMERLNQQAMNDIKELSSKYKELERKWNAVTEEMGLDGIVSEEKEVFKQYVEFKNEVEEATAAYWKEHGWRHEQAAQEGLAADVFDSKAELNKAIYPEIKTDNGVVQSEDVRKLFRAEIEAAASAVEVEKYLPKAAAAESEAEVGIDRESLKETHNKDLTAEQSKERLDVAPGTEQGMNASSTPGAAVGFSGPKFTPMGTDAKNWARDNQFLNEHIEAHGSSNFHLLENRIRLANVEQDLERGEGNPLSESIKSRPAASNDDKATVQLYERVQKQMERNIAEGKGKPDEKSRELGERIQASLRQQQSLQQQLSEDQRREQAQQHAMAA